MIIVRLFFGYFRPLFVEDSLDLKGEREREGRERGRGDDMQQRAAGRSRRVNLKTTNVKEVTQMLK